MAGVPGKSVSFILKWSSGVCTGNRREITEAGSQKASRRLQKLRELIENATTSSFTCDMLGNIILPNQRLTDTLLKRRLG